MPDLIPPMKFSPDETPWAHWAEKQIGDLQATNDLRTQNDQNVNAGIVATLGSLGRAVRDLPISLTYFDQSTNFGLATTFYVQRNIMVPAGKTKVSVVMVANVSVLDMTTGGVAVASAFLEVNGNNFVWGSPVMGASKDAGASIVVNNVSPVLGFQQAGLVGGDSFLVDVGVSASNPAAFPVNKENFATLSTIAIFS